MGRKKVLFLCTGNSCRSQMAEGLARHFRGDVIDACSAGTVPGDIDTRALAVLAEIGVDMSGQRSKHVNEFAGNEFDLVITLCDGAREACPFFPGKGRKIHAGFDDPPELARTAVTEEEALNHYRRVRDEIRSFIMKCDEWLS